MLYPNHIKHRAPEINLPFPKCTKDIIFKFYEISGENNDPRKTAKCKTCEKDIYMIKGSTVTCSYTFGLTCHLRKHNTEWIRYLDMLQESIIPDTKTKLEHFEALRKRYTVTPVLSKVERSQLIHENDHNYAINRKNCAGVFYTPRDVDLLKNKMCEDFQNVKLLEYLHPYTNQNVRLYDLIGTKFGGPKGDFLYNKSMFG